MHRISPWTKKNCAHRYEKVCHLLRRNGEANEVKNAIKGKRSHGEGKWDKLLCVPSQQEKATNFFLRILLSTLIAATFPRVRDKMQLRMFTRLFRGGKVSRPSKLQVFVVTHGFGAWLRVHFYDNIAHDSITYTYASPSSKMRLLQHHATV